MTQIKEDLILSDEDLDLGIGGKVDEDKEILVSMGRHIIYLDRVDSIDICAHLMSLYNIRCNEIADAMNIPGRCTGSDDKDS